MSSKLHLKSCVSTTEISLHNIFKNLRNDKSCVDQMSGTSSQESIQPLRYGIGSENASELFYKDDDQPFRIEKNIITTQDEITGTFLHINKQVLEEIGHSNEEIAKTFKKDCRMWLWKNSATVKEGRSVAECRELSPKDYFS